MRQEGERRKLYVGVVSLTDEEGAVTPLEVVWPDGRRFVVDRVYDVRRAASTRAGGTGLRYAIRVGGTKTRLWYEGPRWFVEAKVGEAAGEGC